MGFTTKNYKGNKLISMIKDYDKKHYIMTAGCLRRFKGLASGHAYTLLGAYNLNGEDVFKMRNPWSREKYYGPWSDKDKRWTDALRK